MLFKSKREKLEKTQEQCLNDMIKLTNSIIDDTVRKLFSIKDIDELTSTEEEKKNLRHVLINNLINSLLKHSDKMKELSKTAKLKDNSKAYINALAYIIARGGRNVKYGTKFKRIYNRILGNTRQIK